MSDGPGDTLDTEELKEAAENGTAIHVQRYVDGEWMELKIEART